MSTTQDILTSGGELDEQKVADLVKATEHKDRQSVDGHFQEKAKGKTLKEVFAAEDQATPEAAEETTRRDETVRDDDSAAQADDTAGDDDWVSADDIRELIDSLGYSEDDVSEFQSRDEFERHVKLVDRQFMRDGRESQRERPGESQEVALQAKEEATRRQEASERAKQQPRENGRFVSSEPDPDAYQPQLQEDDFDERIIEEFQRLSSHYEARIKSLESRHQEETQRSEVQHFNTIVDSLGHDDLFGKTEELRPRSEHTQNRGKLLEATQVLMAGLASRRGSSPQLTELLVKRAANLEFADHFSKKQRQSFNDRIRKQAARRHGGGSQRASSQTYTGDPTKHPDLLEAYRAMEAENG